SDNTSVATVTDAGVVTAVSAGTANIIYTDENGCQAVAEITVNANPTIDDEAICLSVGETAGSVSLNYSGTPADMTPFVSDNTSVATVTDAGVVTAVSAGTANIIYTDENGCQAVAEITVNANPTINDEAICLSVGETAGSVTLNYFGVPADTTPFVSDNTSVATVTDAGVVTAVSAGTANITYTDENGCQAVAEITVNANPTIDDEAICLSVGETAGSVTLNYFGVPADTTPFVSDNTSVATVTDAGVVTAVSAGTANITYTDENGCQAVSEITVNANPTIDDEAICLSVGETAGSVSLNYSGTPADATPFVSDNTSVATVTDAGVVTAVSAGTANITYTDENGCQAVAEITVNANPIIKTEEPQLTCLGEKPSIKVTSDTNGLEFRLVVKGQSDDVFTDYPIDGYDELNYETSYVLTARSKTSPTFCETDYEFTTPIEIDTPIDVILEEINPTCDSFDGSTYFGSIQITNHVSGYLYAVVSQEGFTTIEDVPNSEFMTYDSPPNETAGLISGIAVGDYFVIAKSPDLCLSTQSPASLVTPECMTCETAFAKRGDNLGSPNKSYCFINEVPDDTNASYDLEINANRWGWTNFISLSEFTSENGYTFRMDLYAAAGQCDINKGTLVGYVDVIYESGEVSVSYEMLSGYWLGGVHTYVGQEPYMWKKKGKTVEYTVAPGQYPFNSNGGDYTYATTIQPITVQGVTGFYVIAHADVCTTNTEEYNQRLLTEAEPIDVQLNKRNNSMIYSPSSGGKPQKSSTSTSLTETSDPLFSVAPVPFRDVLNIGYLFDYTSDVTIQVFDLNGRLLATYKDSAVNSASISSFNVDFRTKSNQIYIVRMTTDREIYSAKIIAAK
ncbi:Ig-like domain-containing protein, partial [Christiangramia sp. ASW11-125]|uniref:Ig-like domain-containing protein n=1 Tax=Christiangramia sp. ASW11-125 TaxID=3400701 RepID=UPI003AAD1D84